MLFGYAAEHGKYYRLELHRGNVVLAAMCLWRVRPVGRSFAAALRHVSTAAMPTGPTAQNLGVGLRRPCREQAFGSALGAMVRIALVRPTTLRCTTNIFAYMCLF